MKILLINPKNIRGENYIIIPNIGLGYLASALLKNKHNVAILDCIKENYGCRELQKYLKDRDFDVVGISVYTPAINSVKEYIKIIKNSHRDAFIVVGGPHPSVEPIETMQILNDADFGFCGEGEAGFPKLVNLLGRNNNVDRGIFSSIPNLIWRDNNRIICNQREVIKDLNELDFPAWDLIKPQDYPPAPNGIFSKQLKIAPVITTRGCPHSCTFCAAGTISGKRIRMRKIENVLEEINLLRKKFDIREIHILDDGFTQFKNYTMNFSESLLKNGMRINWACPGGVRLDSLNEELLKTMEKSGCYSLAVGIESGTQRILDQMEKRLTIEEIREKVSLIKKVTRIRVTGFFLIGYPGERIYDVERTIELAVNLNIDRANFFNFTPFPGSEIYGELKKRKELNDINYDDLYIHNISYSSEYISKKKMKQLQKKSYIKFYLRPKILFGLIREIKSLCQLKIILRRGLKIIFHDYRNILLSSPR